MQHVTKPYCAKESRRPVKKGSPVVSSILDISGPSPGPAIPQRAASCSSSLRSCSNPSNSDPGLKRKHIPKAKDKTQKAQVSISKLEPDS